MKRVNRFIPYSTYKLDANYEWYVEVILDLETKIYDFYLFTPSFATKKHFFSIPQVNIDYKDEIIDYVDVSWSCEIAAYIADHYVKKDEANLASISWPDLVFCNGHVVYRKSIAASMKSIDEKAVDFCIPKNSIYERKE